uniref:Uncharacterized protein n=1 Tax=Knipowitschia caucasica TaxID=637954 RepID=A0AAV2MQW3_KNICA
METDADAELDPDTDDLPLRANIEHILVRHYVLDLTVHLDRRVISGNVVLFLEPNGTEAGALVEADDQRGIASAKDVEKPRASSKKASSHSWESSGGGEDFTLVLDCCDLSVSKVEEVDITSVSGWPGCSARTDEVTLHRPGSTLAQTIMSLPSERWKLQHQLYSQCSSAPSVQDQEQLRFFTDRWSLQVRKRGVRSPHNFPQVLRIFYETTPTGGSLRWTQDQDLRSCVYTAGSPINNRALFPCMEPPVAMSTWQAVLRAPAECVVLMSGEEQAVPRQESSSGFLIWFYYVTMPMPASTLALAVGHWHLVPTASNCASSSNKAENSAPGEGCSDVADSLQIHSESQTTRSEFAFCRSSPEDEDPVLTDYSGPLDDGISCSHGDYPCRFSEQRAMSQQEIPHRVFAPLCLLQRAQLVLNLLPRCLAAAHSVLGGHPFSRLDVLIVTAGFSSLGMARTPPPPSMRVALSD